jgi:hypothetical protein
MTWPTVASRASEPAACDSAQKPGCHLILGPTGIGKTRRAVAAAAEGGCPVIALDRIQCHPQIGIGSGRPAEDELAGTTRLYLDDRPLSDGPISAGPAIDRLVHAQRLLLGGGAGALVVEGGSISLIRELTGRSDWCEGWTVRVTVCVEGSARRYEEGVTARVEEMVGYGAGPARTVQDELADLWDDPLARKHAGEVIGYREAIDLCEQHSVLPQELTGPHGHLWRYELSSRIRDAHLAYSRQQRAVIAEALPALHDLTQGVQLCES